jgi:hypothetical protein
MGWNGDCGQSGADHAVALGMRAKSRLCKQPVSLLFKNAGKKPAMHTAEIFRIYESLVQTAKRNENSIC